ncbi:SDR family oxidoreductase [bacterium]|nr:SDR family oxidoreductase [bacterium]
MNILVTGASRGIGKRIALDLKNSGNLFVCARNENLLKEIGAKDYCVCDLADDLTELKEFISKNKIDVLLNNAGEYIYGGIETMTNEQIEHIFKVNVQSALFLASCAVPYMKENHWGRIINIGSISGVMGEANASLYSASKSALIGMSKALALELASDGITVNTINPGWVDTELGEKSIEESEFSKEEILECIPQRRFVSPEEISAYVKYLISDDAKGITGQSINICAGLSVGI